MGIRYLVLAGGNEEGRRKRKMPPLHRGKGNWLEGGRQGNERKETSPLVLTLWTKKKAYGRSLPALLSLKEGEEMLGLSKRWRREKGKKSPDRKKDEKIREKKRFATILPEGNLPIFGKGLSRWAERERQLKSISNAFIQEKEGHGPGCAYQKSGSANAREKRENLRARGERKGAEKKGKNTKPSCIPPGKKKGKRRDNSRQMKKRSKVDGVTVRGRGKKKRNQRGKKLEKHS